MIKQFFPSKKPIVKPVVVYSPPPGRISHLTEEQRAAKRGLSIEIYRHRVVAVAKAQALLQLFVTDQGFPVTPEDYEEYGQCIVVGICRHYDDYGTVAWNDPPFILSVSPIKDRQKIIQCTANWLVKGAVSPHKETQEVC
jgi:hypothetical protein